MMVVGSGTTGTTLIRLKMAPSEGPVIVMTVGSELASRFQTVSYSTHLPKGSGDSITCVVASPTWVAPEAEE